MKEIRNPRSPRWLVFIAIVFVLFAIGSYVCSPELRQDYIEAIWQTLEGPPDK